MYVFVPLYIQAATGKLSLTHRSVAGWTGIAEDEVILSSDVEMQLVADR